MIIGINGKIGSGKDTIGKIIQHLTSEWGDEEFQDTDMLDVRSNWEIKKFAGKLKTIASILTGIPVENFEYQEYKKTLLGPEWGTVKENPLNSIPAFEDIDFNHLMSVRELLQKLGTEAMRDGLHANVWVNALFANYTDKNNWCITDMRFPNEMKAVEDKGGITIRVNRPYSTVVGQGNGNPATFSQTQFHPSETALDGAKFTYEINNDGTMEDLVKKVRGILIKENIY